MAIGLGIRLLQCSPQAVIRRLNAQLQHIRDRVVLDVRDSRKRLINARLFDHPDDRHLEPVIRPEYLDAAPALRRADLRPVIMEELIEAGPSIGIECRTTAVRDNPAKIAHCPQRVEKEPIFPERLSVRSEFEMTGHQFFGTCPSQHLSSIDPFWHHEIARPKPKGHNRRKLAASVVVGSIIHIRRHASGSYNPESHSPSTNLPVNYLFIDEC